MSSKISSYRIILKYYPHDNELRNILLVHSRCVAKRALTIAKSHPEWNLDLRFIAEAAMLHDIGITQCNAPGICCMGTEPYIRHGILGAAMLRQCGLERHARVCERHTGTGITREAIQTRNLPLPLGDYSPETWEEKIICYADKFYSKTHIDAEKTHEQALQSLKKFGEAGLTIFKEWAWIFEKVRL